MSTVETIARGKGWRLDYDSVEETSWLVVEDAKGLRVGERQVEVLLPDELADFIDVSWRNRQSPLRVSDLRAAVLSIFTQSRWGRYSAMGVLHICYGTAEPCINVLPNIGAATEQDLAGACEGLAEEGLLLRHRVHNHVTYELNRERFPLTEPHEEAGR